MLDEQEGSDLLIHGLSGFPSTVTRTEAGREEQTGKKRRIRSGSRGLKPCCRSIDKSLMNLKDSDSKILHQTVRSAHRIGKAAWLPRRATVMMQRWMCTPWMQLRRRLVVSCMLN